MVDARNMTARGIQTSGKVADSSGWLRESHPGASLPMHEWIQIVRAIIVEAPGIEDGADVWPKAIVRWILWVSLPRRGCAFCRSASHFVVATQGAA